MIEISIFKNAHDYANNICKIRERVDSSDITCPLADIYRTFKYLYPGSVIEIVVM